LADSVSLRDLADQLAAKLEISKATAYDALGETFGTIVQTIAKGGKVSIFQFGTFTQKSRAARMGRNPQTGAAIKIAASKTIGFKPAKAAKNAKPKAVKAAKPAAKAAKKK
jgi:nucleoid DNA-binding protein